MTQLLPQRLRAGRIGPARLLLLEPLGKIEEARRASPFVYFREKKRKLKKCLSLPSFEILARGQLATGRRREIWLDHFRFAYHRINGIYAVSKLLKRTLSRAHSFESNRLRLAKRLPCGPFSHNQTSDCGNGPVSRILLFPGLDF